MFFIIPTWLFQALLIAYFILLAVLTYVILIKPIGAGQKAIMLLVLWMMPVAGAIIVLLALNNMLHRKRLVSGN